jgi:AcrR family transcriptional regulator
VTIEARRLQVMDVTERLIAEQGFDGLRLRDVAKGANVSIGLIQHYFDTRDALVLETLSRASWRRAEQWASLGAAVTDPVERTQMLLRGSIADRERCQAWIETCASSTRHPELLPMISRIYEAWRGAFHDALRGGIEAGVFGPVMPLDQVLDTIMAMIDGLMVAVGLRVYEFDRAYTAMLLQDVTGQLLRYDFRASPSDTGPHDGDAESSRSHTAGAT